jgi:hypothetical protein
VDIGMKKGSELGEALGGWLISCDRNGRHAVGLFGQDGTCIVIVN